MAIVSPLYTDDPSCRKISFMVPATCELRIMFVVSIVPECSIKVLFCSPEQLVRNNNIKR